MMARLGVVWILQAFLLDSLFEMGKCKSIFRNTLGICVFSRSYQIDIIGIFYALLSNRSHHNAGSNGLTKGEES